MAVPTSTYRLQISPRFTLDDAAAVLGYLATLGVGAVYCSPLLPSAAGSDHGYDVVDHTHIDSARGGDEAWKRFLDVARAEDLAVVVDIVPNHVGVADASENRTWWDLLTFGRDSVYATWYDVDWTSGRIRLPVLGDDADPERDLQVVDDELHYYDHRFPIRPGTEGGRPADVHDRQHYELVNFRRADAEQNYRRFFAVTSLAGVRVEDDDVFEATHAEILRWVERDGIEGLRIDHPDGLADPLAYLTRLSGAAPEVWLTVEKILEPGEALPADWPAAGTTGYDALTEVSQVLTDADGLPALDRVYRELTSDGRDFHQHVAAGKRGVASTILQAEVRRLARLGGSLPDAEEALRELIVAFAVYRSYAPLGLDQLAAAVETVHARRPELDAPIAALTDRLGDPTDELCVRFQQATGAVMAKGVEDTAYYRYTRFIAANEVGGDPARPAFSVEDFHATQVRRQAATPTGMTTLSTHDTKRGEDVRARLMVLAEQPDRWAELARHCLAAAPVPNPAFGYLLWQTLVGVGFIERDRLHAYAEKAMREANDGTRWIDPDEAFEAAVHAAVDTAYDDPALRQRLEAFIVEIEPYGWSNSLSQKLLGLTMPGVPDVYQGTELWEDSLVDPDNRRLVDYATRRHLLSELDRPPVDASGAAKQWLVKTTLHLRRDAPELFTTYQPVPVASPHVVAYDRGGVVAVATRRPFGLAGAGGWGEATIDLPHAGVDVLTGRERAGRVMLAELLDSYPVALVRS